MLNGISVHDRVKQYRDGYAANGGRIENYLPEQLLVEIDEQLKQSIECRGFMGAGKSFILRSVTSYSIESPAFIAASVMTIMVRNALNLGLEGREEHPQPVQIYAPQLFNLSARHISIGDVRFLEQPSHGVLACERLTLLKTTEEVPEHFEVVRSWLKHDNTQVEFSIL